MPMKIDRVVVRWGETFNMGDYSNVSPAVELSATIAPGDDAGAVTDALMDAAQRFVREMIDQALEQREKPAHYSNDQRFDLWVAQILTKRYLVIAPAGEPPPLELSAYRAKQGHRLESLRAVASAITPRENVLDIILDGSQIAIADIYTHLRELVTADRSTKLHAQKVEQVEDEGF